MMMKYEDNRKDFSDLLKKWSPGIALVVLTIALMVFFKLHQGKLNTILEKGKGQLAKFYSENLQPLVEETTITNEDVFNFALYGNLPVNKDRKRILQIAADEHGDEYFEILPANVNSRTQNLDNFIDFLDFNQGELDSLNTILDSYRYPIYASILVKDDVTIAVDPNIINIQRALLADLMRFANANEPSKANKIIPVDYSIVQNPKIDTYVEEIKSAKPAEYIFYAPDTIFNVQCEVDKQKLYTSIREAADSDGLRHNLQISDYVKHVNETREAETLAENFSFNYVKENEGVKIYPSAEYVRSIVLPELQQVNEELAEFSIKLTSDITDIAKVSSEISAVISNREMSEDFDIKVGEDFQFEFNLEDFAENFEENIKSYSEKDWEEFGLKMQNIALKFARQFEDSLSVKEREELRKEMKRIKEELREVSKEVSKPKKLYKPERR